MIAQRHSCYCAFCKTQRNIYRSRSLNFVEIVSLTLLGLLMTSIIWSHLDSRGLVLVFTMLFTSEVFYRVRWRQSIICHSCGFDPVLYIKDPAMASLKIKAFIEDRKENPRFLLRAPLNLPHRAPTEKLSLRV